MAASSNTGGPVRRRQDTEWLEDDAVEPDVSASIDEPPVFEEAANSEGEREWCVRLRLKQQHLANLWSRRLTNNDTVVWWPEQQSWAPVLAIPEILAAIRKNEQASAVSGTANGDGSTPDIGAHLAARTAVADLEDKELNSLLVPRSPGVRSRSPVASSRPSSSVTVPGAPRVPTFGAGLLRGVVKPPSSAPQPDNPYALPSELASAQADSSQKKNTSSEAGAVSVGAGQAGDVEHSESVVPVTASVQSDPTDGIDIDIEIPKKAGSAGGRLVWFAAGVIASLGVGYLAFGPASPLGAETRQGRAAEAVASDMVHGARRADSKDKKSKTKVVSADELPVLDPAEQAAAKAKEEAGDGLGPAAKQAGAEDSPNEPGSKKKKAKAAAKGQGFDVASARQALAWAASQVSKCATGEASGTLTVTFAPSGAVTHASISGLKGGDGISKSCIVRAFKSVHVPAFSGGDKVVKKSFRVK